MRINLIKNNFFIWEAVKINLFCVLVIALFYFFGASSEILLIMFNLAVMSCAATFSPEKKHFTHVLCGSIIMLLSILLAGVIDFYMPLFANALVIFYAVLAFLLPRAKLIRNVFVTSAVMCLIFTALPFDFHVAAQYVLYGLGLVGVMLLFYWLFDRKLYAKGERIVLELSEGRKVTALIAGIALLAAWLASHLFKEYTTLHHLYWIGLTVLVVIQSSQQKTIKTALTRIAVNASGAIIIAVLMTYIMPQSFWVNFSLLAVFLIFALGFSYVLRTLFIELFVLGFTHLLGSYQNIIALDRVVLTLGLVER